MRGWLGLAGLAFGLVGCGTIPEAYRGKFVDEYRGFTLELGAHEGRWQKPGGEAVRFEARALDSDRLARGERGIYVRSVEESDSLEIFWVDPDRSTLIEQYGVVYVQAQVAHARVRPGFFGNPISSIRAGYCERGRIIIDQKSQSFDGSCPGGARPLELKRARGPSDP